MTTAEIATEFAALCKAGKFEEAGTRFWSDDIVSVEPGGPDPASLEARGIAAVTAKGEWWYGNHDIHSVEAAGPFVNADQFIMRFKMDVTIKASGQRMQIDEDGLYTVRDGKIVEERFFYGS
jgi:ketosteroid isomerase-like protein